MVPRPEARAWGSVLRVSGGGTVPPARPAAAATGRARAGSRRTPAGVAPGSRERHHRDPVAGWCDRGGAGRGPARPRSRSSTRSRESMRCATRGVKPAMGRQRAQHVLVGGVPRVHDPVAVGAGREGLRPLVRRHARRPTRRPTGGPRRARVATRRARCRSRRRARGPPGPGPGGRTPRAARARALARRRPGGAAPRSAMVGSSERSDRGREPRHAQHAGGLGGRVEVEPRGVHRRQDRHGVLRQPVPGRREAHPPPVGLDQGGAGLARQRGDALGDARGGRPQRGRDLVPSSPRRESSSSSRSRRTSMPPLCWIRERSVHAISRGRARWCGCRLVP